MMRASQLELATCGWLRVLVVAGAAASCHREPPPLGPTLVVTAPAPAPPPPPPPPPVSAAPPSSAAVTRAPWAVANEDPNDDAQVGPPAEDPGCLAALERLGVRAKPSSQPVHAEGKRTCGAPQVLSYQAGPTGARWSSPPQVTCLVALGLARFEVILQEEAERQLGSKVKRIDQMGTYSCRPMVRFNLASEHSFVNAIDISGVELDNGTRVTVLANWGAISAPPATASSRFLRTVARRTYDESVFSVVLGPPWDALHANHLHLDQARYRVDGLLPRAGR